jgi:hypothetical protein
MLNEKNVHLLIINYLKTHYPNVIFRTDFSSGMKMSIGMARKHKSLQYSNAYPDLFIAEPRNGYHGLFIEIKKDPSVAIKKDGELRDNKHLQEQANMLERLREKGYYATFGMGYNKTISIINTYLDSD